MQILKFMQKTGYLVAILVSITLLSACASGGMTPPGQDAAAVARDDSEFSPYDPGKMPKMEYRIRRGDGLSIRFLYNSELNVSNIQVRDDGMISVPIIGDVLAVNKTTSQLTNDIRAGLKEFVDESGHGNFLKSGDILQLRFTYNPQLNQRIVVRPDGKVSLLKLGELQADGVAFSDFEQQVLTGYKDYIRDPEMSMFLLNTRTSRIYADAGDLTVLVTAPQPKEVFIGGEVGNPAVISFTDWLTPLQAISQAGGLQPGADGGRVVYITQGEQGEAITTLVNLDAYLQNGAKANLYLRHGDILIVPRSGIAKLNLAVQQYIRDALPVSTSLGFSYPLRQFNSNEEQNDSTARISGGSGQQDSGGGN